MIGLNFGFGISQNFGMFGGQQMGGMGMGFSAGSVAGGVGGKNILGGLGGGILGGLGGGLLGFTIGGPVGALIGGVLGAGVGGQLGSNIGQHNQPQYAQQQFGPQMGMMMGGMMPGMGMPMMGQMGMMPGMGQMPMGMGMGMNPMMQMQMMQMQMMMQSMMMMSMMQQQGQMMPGMSMPGMNGIPGMPGGMFPGTSGARGYMGTPGGVNNTTGAGRVPVEYSGGKLAGRPHGLQGILKEFGPPGQNQVTVSMPAGPNGKMIKVTCHRKIAPKLQAVYQEIKARGLSRHIKQFSGSYNNRSKRGGSSKSTHAWGIAVDVNAGENPMGRSTQTPGQRAIAEVFKKHGFHQLKNDPMHFQYATGY